MGSCYCLQTEDAVDSRVAEAAEHCMCMLEEQQAPECSAAERSQFDLAMDGFDNTRQLTLCGAFFER